MLEVLPQRSLAEDHEPGVRHVPHHERGGVDKVTLSLVRHQRGDIAHHRRVVRQPVLRPDVNRRRLGHAFDVDPLMHGDRTAPVDAVLHEQATDRFGRDGQEALGEVGLAEEPRRVLVVRVGPAVAHLVEVHGELGCVERFAFPEVFPRVDDFVPGLQCHLGLRKSRGNAHRAFRITSERSFARFQERRTLHVPVLFVLSHLCLASYAEDARPDLR